MDDLYLQCLDDLVEAVDLIAEATRTQDAAIVNRQIRAALHPAPAHLPDPDMTVIVAAAAQVDIVTTMQADRLAWAQGIPALAPLMRGDLPMIATGVAAAVRGRDLALIEPAVKSAVASVAREWKNPSFALITALAMQIDTYTPVEDRIAWTLDPAPVEALAVAA